MISQRLIDLLADLSPQILDGQRLLKVTRLLSWDRDVERRFFAAKGNELPQPAYRLPPDLGRHAGRFRELRGRLSGSNEIERFLRETCDSLATAAQMLAAVGTRAFYFQSVEIYGRPASLASDRKTTNLDLARHFAEVVTGFVGVEPGEDDRPTLEADTVADELRGRLDAFFAGSPAPITVEIDDGIAAQAAASSGGVKLKRGARFSRRDLAQIESHEGHVHIATALNGRMQPHLPFIGHASPRSTRTQEGLAVLTEFLTQSTSLERLRRLSDRTIAIQMAEDGADFIQLYRFFLGRGHDEAAAFDCARRVCRGGLVQGGAPFTKDVCYLDGLLRVTNFLRVALCEGQSAMVRLLFAGKVDVEDVPLLARLGREGLLREPTYLPPWARDLSYLTAFMSYSAFLGETDLGDEKRRIDDRMARADGDLA